MSQSPYLPPKSNVSDVEESQTFDFRPETHYSFTPRRLWQAGVLSLVNIPLIVVLVVMSLQAGQSHSVSPLMLLLLWLQTALALYVLWLMKKVLQEKSHYHAASLAISLVMLGALIAAVLDPFLIQQTHTAATVINLVEIILNGALLIYLGKTLLRCPDPLYGDLKLIGYFNIAAGICFVTVFLVFLGLVLYIPLAFYTARLFFRASQALHKAAN